MSYRYLLVLAGLSAWLAGPAWAVDSLPQAAQAAQAESIQPVVRAGTGKQLQKDPDAVSEQAWSGAFASGAGVVTPHRAVYAMSLASVKNGSNITGVKGRMLFEWADVCDGWAVQQHLQLHFTYAEGDESDVDSSVVSWESKDGSRYTFNVRRVVNGQETERYRGKATVGASGGAGVYSTPSGKADIPLPQGALFPSAHTLLILREAEKGDKFFTRRVFDGSDETGAADVSAFIGPALLPADQANGQASGQASGLSERLRKDPLVNVKAWPVRLAFFQPDSETGEPDYEMDLVIQANGIARSMQIDYGDFAVGGTLTDLKALPAAGCSD